MLEKSFIFNVQIRANFTDNVPKTIILYDISNFVHNILVKVNF